METPGLVKYAGALLALAIVSACGASSAVAPSSAAPNVRYVGRTLFLNGRPVTAARVNALPSYATILPDRHLKSTYEYVISDYGSYASIFDYPKSVKQIGEIPNVGGQGCTNAQFGYGNGIIWIVAGQDQISEYKVLKTFVKSLSVTYSFPSSCAMDTSGDLAVGILYGDEAGPNSGSGGGDVVIFKNGSGSGKAYGTPLDEEFFDGYDPKGNLFADGFTGDRTGFALTELPKGSSEFVRINTSNSPEFPGSVQWDGTYLTVFDQDTSEVYRYTVSGTTATLKGTVTLSGAGDCAETWIVKGLLYCGDATNDDGEVFKYPAGGSAIATLEGNFDYPLGVTAARK